MDDDADEMLGFMFRSKVNSKDWGHGSWERRCALWACLSPPVEANVCQQCLRGERQFPSAGEFTNTAHYSAKGGKYVKHEGVPLY